MRLKNSRVPYLLPNLRIPNRATCLVVLGEADPNTPKPGVCVTSAPLLLLVLLSF